MSYVKNLQSNKKQQKSKTLNSVFKYILLALTLFVVFVILASFAFLIIRGIEEVPQYGESWTNILFGSEFDMGGKLAMGIIVVNTVWMSILVLLVATPISVATALFITKVANKTFRNIMIALVSILAAIPSVVYGAFGKYFLLQLISNIGLSELPTDATLLSVIIIITIMVMPTITLMSTTSIMMVDSKMEDSSEALGATKMQTSFMVTLKSAKTGIIVGMLFALGRCLGEATAISMISGARPIAEGVTFKLSEVSLFMSPVIMGAFVSSSLYPAAEFTYVVMSSLLLMTIIILFLTVKIVENKTDDRLRSMKQSKKAVETNNVLIKIEESGQDSLSPREQYIYSSYLNSLYREEVRSENIYLQRNNEVSLIRSRSSLDSAIKESSYKKRKNSIYLAGTIALSMFGIIALFSVVSFLLQTDLSLLSDWEYLTSTGPIRRVVDGENVIYWGIGMAMFGTMITIIVVLLIAMPLGIAIATYSYVYITQDKFLSKFISFSFQIMTSIPAVIYGVIAAIIFTQTGFIESEFRSFEPMIMLVLVILPTIIKQTQEGFKNVKQSQMDGSLALGATEAYSSRRIIIKQSMPAILSAAILGISIVMADSAIFITIIGNPSHYASTDLWIDNGGFTLATTIYWLSNNFNEGVKKTVAIEQIKVIGIILMILIFWLTIISQKVKNGNNLDSLVMFIGIMMFMSSFFLFGGIKLMMIAGPILGIIGMFTQYILEKVNYGK